MASLFAESDLAYFVITMTEIVSFYYSETNGWACTVYTWLYSSQEFSTLKNL